MTFANRWASDIGGIWWAHSIGEHPKKKRTYLCKTAPKTDRL